MALTKVRGAGLGTLSGDTTTVTLEDTSSHSANTGPAISFKTKDSGETTREVAKIIGESHSGTNEGNLALQTRNGGTLETKWKLFKNGNFIPSNTEYGIILGATATGDSNLLNDYETGTWTPSLGGNTTYHAQVGKYTKIGDVVHAAAVIQANSLGTGSTTAVSGFPFTSSNAGAGYQGGDIGFYYFLANNVMSLDVQMGNSATTTTFSGRSSAGNTITSSIAVFANGARIDFSVTYYAA